MFSSHNPSRQRYTRDVITNLCLHAVKADAETAKILKVQVREPLCIFS